MNVSIMGGSGYIGGELVRLLLSHPHAHLTQVSSSHLAGQPISVAHPNLRGQTELRFVRDEMMTPSDVLFVTRAHGVTMRVLPQLIELAPIVIDLSADFRLRDPADYDTYYGTQHPASDWLARFVPGIPELHRKELREARYIATPGCMANAAILALNPLSVAGLIDGTVTVDARTGSSGSGSEPSAASHHAERSGAMRVFQPLGHRHEAEVRQVCRVPVRMSATAVEAVRGVQVLCHVSLTRPLKDRDIWQLYRQQYGDEPFIRLVKQRSGLYRLPEPKILIGSNFCDIGFALSPEGDHLVLVAALDNLVKGGAGNAVQCFNILAGHDERDGLRFPGLHPI